MNMLATYDRAMSALAAALKSTSIDVVKEKRIEIEFIKLHARRIQDKEVLAAATEIQMRMDRWLGTLLRMAEDAGDLAVKGRQRKLAEGAPKPATLKEIGIKRKFSVTAKWAAAMESTAFEAIVTDAVDKIRSGSAVLVDPIQNARKDAEIAGRRSAHAARTLDGGCIEDLGTMVREGRKFGSIGSDPQWKFLTRSEAGEGRSANVHYKTEEVDKIKNLPVGQLLADDGAFYMWMVDWCPQDALDLLAHWGLKHITTAFTWVKTNSDAADLNIWSNSTWAFGQGYWTRANPEQCWFATKLDSKKKPKRLYADVRQLIVAPVMEHSRKPDAWLDRIERLTAGDYLELQARRPRKGWMSWGDELEFTGVAA